MLREQRMQWAEAGSMAGGCCSLLLAGGPKEASERDLVRGHTGQDMDGSSPEASRQKGQCSCWRGTDARLSLRPHTEKSNRLSAARWPRAFQTHLN